MPRPLSPGAVAALAVVALLAACTAGPEPTPSPTPPPPSGDGILRIGTLFGTTGAGAALATGQTAGVNAAVRDVGATGVGVPVEVINRDAGDPDAFAQLVEAGVDVVIGPSDVEQARELIPLARDAAIPLISPSAVGVRPEGSDGVLYRTVPSAAAEGAAVAAALGDGPIVLVRSDDPDSRQFADGMRTGLGERELADIVATDDAVADAARVTAAAPGSVVVATDRDVSTALLAALGEAGVGADRLWLVGAAMTGYDDAAGALEGAHGIRSGVPTDQTIIAALRREDPGLRSTRHAAEAYDAVVLAALAAAVSGDDGGASITAALPAVAGDGIPCGGYAECLDVRDDGQEIDYQGWSGPFGFDERGDRDAVRLVRYVYGADNRPQPAM